MADLPEASYRDRFGRRLPPSITVVEGLRFAPGDILVVSCPWEAPVEHVAELKRELEEALPELRVVVVAGRIARVGGDPPVDWESTFAEDPQPGGCDG